MKSILFYHHKRILILLLMCLGISGRLSSAESNWPSWRGPQSNGSTTSGHYASKWDPEHVLWKAALPGKGCSTPIVWNERVYLTAPTNDLDAVLCFDWSGQLQWLTSFGAENPGKHRNGSGSNPSAVTDGRALFAYFKSGTLAGLELDGKIRWQVNLVERFGPETLYWDHGTSPVLTEKYVVMARMHAGDSWLAAFDKQTGEMAWKVPRNYQTPTEGDHSYATPLVLSDQDREVIVVWGAEHLTAHEPLDGKTLWSCGDFNPEARGFLPAVASPVPVGNMVVVPHGRADRAEARLHGIKLGGNGDVTSTHRAWRRDGIGAFVPTPAAFEGRVYVLRDRGEVDCLDGATGQPIWSNTLPRSSSSYYSSPTIADGKLYAAREDGVIFVAKIEGAFEVLSEIKMNERIIASIVPVANRLFIRGEKNLFCVAAD